MNELSNKYIKEDTEIGRDKKNKGRDTEIDRYIEILRDLERKRY